MTSAASKASAASATRWMLGLSTPSGRSARTLCTPTPSAAESSTWTSTATPLSGWSRSLTGLATLCVEKGLATPEELERRAQGGFPLAGAVSAGRTNVVGRQAFQPGDRVRVREEHVAGHVRMPGYIRGKCGVVVGVSPPYPFPDAHAHGVDAVDEPTYDVRFRTEELWPDTSDSALVHVAVFESYLRPEA